MPTSTRRLTRWAVAAAGALTLGLFGAAAPASAQPNIDPDDKGMLTIHKFEEPVGGGVEHDGSELSDGDTAGLQPLNGVEFTVRRVNDADLSVNQGWEWVEARVGASVDPDELDLGPGITGVTGSGGTDGVATFPNLELGVYLVTESDHGDHNIVRSVAPFLVTVPMPTGDNTWNYDVHVYPKNSVTHVEKDVDDSEAYVLGDEVHWPVTVAVPRLPSGETFERFVITDELDPRLAYVGAEVTLHDSADASVPLESGDYEITHADGTVTLTFTEDGLEVLDGAQGGEVALTITTTVESIDDTVGTSHGVIINDALVEINDFEVRTNDAETHWGALKIVKFANDGQDRSYLEGAEFQIFLTESDAAEETNALEFDGSATLTTNDAGEILVPGLKAGDYWIVETKAPLGYTGVEEPIGPITVTAGSVAGAKVVDVENEQKPPFELPLTGAAGTVLFSIAGLGLIAIAAGAALRHRSRSARATS